MTSVLGIHLDFEQSGATTSYAANLGYSAGDKLTFYVESVTRDAKDAKPERVSLDLDADYESSLATSASQQGDPVSEAVSSWLRRIGFYHFHDTSITSVLRQNSPGSDDTHFASDGRNLAAFLYRLMRSKESGDRAAWRRINLLVRRIAPAIVQLEPQPVVPGDDEDNPRHVQLRWRDDRGETFGVEVLSDGSLRAIALVTALAQPTSTLPAFISIDEPELGLHPAALTLLAGLVRSVSSQCQVVLATQSPALLDHFEPEEVVVVEREDGATTLRRLDPDALEAWLADYSLSELYDKNVLGGRP